MSNEYYKRQVILPEVGLSGQKLLDEAKVLVIGAGGLGHPVLLYLAGAGVGRIGIVDHDKIELTNLHRQVLFTKKDIGKYKVDIISKKIQEQNPYININSHQLRLDEDNISLLNDYDLILDCTDNFHTKFLVHDFCFINSINLIQASIHKFEGTLNVFKYQELKNGCFRCLWDQQPTSDAVGSCNDIGVFGVVAGIFGTLQASEAIKLILGLKTLDNNKTLCFDVKSMEMNTFTWIPNQSCSFCKNPSIKINNQIEVNKLKNSIAINVDTNFNIDNFIDQYDSSLNYLFICEKGINSFRTAKLLQNEGYIKCFSLRGGISGMA